MSWQQLVCQTSRQLEEAVCQLLEDQGAVSVTYQDAGDTPVLEPLPGETPLWDNLVITGLFTAEFDLNPLIEALQEEFPKQITLHTERLEEQQWERSWMKDYHPMKFGNNLWIYPSHYEPPEDGSVQILLDPGLAFGTGTHPTTALCLEWLDQNPPVEQTVIDYGCGSGVLAIAAIKLGARHVIATDIDAQALTATQNNMRDNQIEPSCIDTCLPDKLPPKQVDLILANILSGPLASLAPTFAELVRSGGTVVLSGILQEQQQSILDAYTPFFNDLTVKSRQEWLRITGTRR